MLKHAAILAGLVAVFFFLAKGTVMSGPFGYDEADYMYTVSQGVVANATDTPTLPLPELVRTGLSRGRDASHRSELSEMIRSSADMVFYRHWHGPLYIYWLSIVKPFASNEQAIRTWNYVFPVATSMLIYFGALWVLEGVAGQIAALLGAMLFLWSFPVVSASELAPHELFVLCAVATLLLLAKMLATAQTTENDVRKYWYAAIAGCAFAFCTLEIAFVLIATLLICGHAARGRLKLDVAFAVRSMAAFVVPVLVIWPAAILKLSFVKAYLFMAYLAMFRKGAWGTDISVAETWWLRLTTTPIPWIVLAAAVYLMVFRRAEAWSRALLPFAVYSVSMFLAILRVNTEFPRYVLPLFPAVILLEAFALGLFLSRFGSRIRYAAVAVIYAAMFLTTYPELRALPRKFNPKDFDVLNVVRQNDLTHKKLLVPLGYLPTIHYYFPETHPEGYRDESAVPAELERASFDGVIYSGDPPRYAPVR